MHSGAKLTAKDATDTKTPANSTSPRPESIGRRPGPGFCRKSQKHFKRFFGLPEQDRVLNAHEMGMLSAHLPCSLAALPAGLSNSSANEQRRRVGIAFTHGSGQGVIPAKSQLT